MCTHSQTEALPHSIGADCRTASGKVNGEGVFHCKEGSKCQPHWTRGPTVRVPALLGSLRQSLYNDAVKRQEHWGIYLGSAVVLTAAAYAVRLRGLDASSLWYDETFTLYHAQQGVFPALRGLLQEDNALPLYGVLLALWVKATGPGAFTARYLSVLLGTLGVPLVIRLSGKVTGRRIGGWGSALAYTLLPICVYYAQEVRMYALAMPLAAAFAWMGWRLIRGRGGWGYVILGLMMFSAHLYTGLLWIAMCVWGAVTYLAGNRRLRRRWWIANLRLLLLALPIAGWALWRAMIDATATSAVSMSVVRWLPSLYGVGQYLREPWAMLFFWISLLGLLTAVVQLARAKRWSSIVWLVSGLMIPIVLVMLMTAIKAKWSERYLLPSAGLVWVTWIGLGWELGASPVWSALSQRRSQATAGHALSGACHALMGLAWSAMALAAVLLQARGDWVVGIRDEWRPRPDFRAVGAYITAQSKPSDAIVVIGGYAAHTLQYYYDGPAGLFGLPADTRLLDTRRLLDLRALSTLEERVGDADRLWLVLWQSNLADPTNLVQSTLIERCRRLPVDEKFTNVGVLLFDLRECRPLDGSVTPPEALAVSFVEPISLIGYDVIRTDETWEIDLWWRAAGDLQTDLSVFVHLVDAQGKLVGQHDHIAGADAYPTSHWNPDTLLRDRFFITVPGGTCQGCHLWVGLYTPQGRLALQDGRDLVDIALEP